ncbi:siderophore-interacting protein [Janibacter sp. GXQ6167]|uniref:siderophore-interacting protein n=1 Tax=Janibacter sp. GXQ6167 TaxID=3240791 RepID=UPI003524FF60
MIGHRIAHDLHRRHATVHQTTELSPRLRRVELTLEEGAASVPWVDMAVADHVKLAFAGEGPLDLSGQRPLVTRDYTVRAVPHPERLVVDMLLHGSGDAGRAPGSRWAATATPGAPVGVLGPRGSRVFPSDRERYVVLGDESAHPAIARWLEEAPASARVDAVISSEDGTTAELPARSGGSVTVTSDAHALADQLRDLAPQPGDLVWAAGEATAMLHLRRAAKELGLARDDVHIDGYWKVGVAGRDHHAPLEQ